MLRKRVVVGLLTLVTAGAAAPADAAGAVARPDPGEAPAAAAYPRTGGARGAAPVRRLPSVEVSVMSFNVCGCVCRGGEVRRTAAFAACTAIRP